MRLVAVLLGLVALALPRPAPACTCSGAIDPTIRIISPPPGVLLPLNGRVRLRMDRSIDVRKVSLRAASGDRVEAELTAWAPGGVKIVEVRPARLLYPGTKYDVVVVRKKTPEPIGSVTTGTGEDRTAPGGARVTDAFVHAMKDCGWCCSEGILGEILIAGLADFGAAEATLAWQVWVGPADGPGYGWAFDAQAIRFGLGPMSCGPALLPRPKGKVTVTARPVDLAGNAGPAIEATLDFANPEPWRKN